MVNDVRMMAMLKSDAIAATLKSALAGMNGLDLEVKAENLAEMPPHLMNGSAPDIFLVDTSQNDPEELRNLSRLISNKHGQMAVLATAKDADVNTIRTLMRIGVTDFIPQPFNKQDLINAVAAARSKLDSANRIGGAVLSFLASGGGVGSTTLAIQTAADLLIKNKKGRNKVCLIDLDLQFGNIAISLDLQSEVGLRQILDNPERVDDEFLTGALNHHGSGIDVLAAPNLILPLEIMTTDLVGQIISWARSQYDYVVIDMPSNWTSWTAFVLKESDMIMMVTDVSVTGVHRCQKQFNLLTDQELDDVPLAIIANRIESGFGSKSVAKQAESALGRKIQCFVREDSKTASAARDQGLLLSEIKSGNRITKDLHAFLEKVRPALVAATEARVSHVSAI